MGVSNYGNYALLLYLEILFQGLFCATIDIRHVVDDMAVLEQCYARANVNRMLKIVAADDDGGMRLP